MTSPLHTALHLTSDIKGSPLPQKSFAEPFRLIFEKATGEVSNIEVRSLGGLRTVSERLEKGELREMDRFSSLEMQLWGLLAERVGLRVVLFFVKTQPLDFRHHSQPQVM